MEIMLDVGIIGEVLVIELRRYAIGIIKKLLYNKLNKETAEELKKKK